MGKSVNVGKARAKRERDEERSEDSDNMQIDNSDDENANQVDVDFGFMNICDDDYHGVTLILKNLLSGEYNGASLADAILEQQNIGTTVKTDDNEGAICAIASILNPHQYDKYEGVQQLKNYILKNARASGSQKAKEMTEAIFGSQILVPGIVIKERLINVPMQISPGLHQVLLDDINWTLVLRRNALRRRLTITGSPTSYSSPTFALTLTIRAGVANSARKVR